MNMHMISMNMQQIPRPLFTASC